MVVGDYVPGATVDEHAAWSDFTFGAPIGRWRPVLNAKPLTIGCRFRNGRRRWWLRCIDDHGIVTERDGQLRQGTRQRSVGICPGQLHRHSGCGEKGEAFRGGEAQRTGEQTRNTCVNHAVVDENVDHLVDERW
jgi:hypothetical protein